MTAFAHVHANQPVLAAGAGRNSARAAAILLHGRGSSALDILGLVEEIEHPQCAFIAPQASGHSWYPFRFIEPIEQNEPYLSSALKVIEEQVAMLNASGVATERILVIGFSQGACLALEFIARSGRRFGGVAALSGGLIGQVLEPTRYLPLQGTPTFLGCSDVDSHIPLARVEESAALLASLGGAVTKRIYPRMAHTINADGLAFVRAMVSAVAKTAP